LTVKKKKWGPLNTNVKDFPSMKERPENPPADLDENSAQTEKKRWGVGAAFKAGVSRLRHAKFKNREDARKQKKRLTLCTCRINWGGEKKKRKS